MPQYPGSIAIEGYAVEVRPHGNGSTWTLASFAVQTLSSTVTGLRPWTEYHLRMRAMTSLGYSEYSEETAATRTLPRGKDSASGRL